MGMQSNDPINNLGQKALGSRRFKWAVSRAAVGSGSGFLAIIATLAIFHSYLAAACTLLGGLAVFWLTLLLNRTQEKVESLETLMDSADAIVITTTSSGTISRFNPGAEKALGYTSDEVVGRLNASIFHLPSEIDGHSASTELVYCPVSEQAMRKEWTYVRRDGTTFKALLSVGTLLRESGEIDGHFGIGIDVGGRSLGEEALREKQELIESIAATSPTVFYIFDLAERRVIYTNRPIPTALGYSEEQSVQMGTDPLPNFIHPEDLDILFERYQKCAELLDGEVLETEFRCLSSMGELRWLYTRDVVFKRDGEGGATQILVNVVDVTERKLLYEHIENQVLEIHDTNLALEIQTNALEEANSQLEALAFTDGLTGIANHRSFQEELAKSFEVAKRRKRRLSLMLIDVDRFKQYNDTYGHPSGDIVLKRVASVLRDSCPDDCIPARYGGEEFAVLCPGFTANEVLRLAEEIRSAIELTPWPERQVTISIGAVSLSNDVSSPSELVGAADNALYSSKASGRNCVTFYDFESRHRMTG